MTKTVCLMYATRMTGRNVLIVDDDKWLVESMTQYLTEDGHTVHYAMNAADAVAAITDHNINVALIDYDLGAYETLTGAEIAQLIPATVQRIVYSGLRREVPEGVEFYGKARLLEIIDAINNG